VSGQSSTRNRVTFFGVIVFTILCGASQALPIKPKIEDIIKDAKKPVVNYPPARAGWNGPEGKPALPTPNATYERLRNSMSPEAARMQLFHAATPDWRALIGLAGLIFTWRYRRSHPHGRQVERPLRPVAVPIAIASNPVIRDKRAA
jgi:hypothetical protein